MVSCGNLSFPAKFKLSNQKMDFEILIKFNKMISIENFDKKYLKNEFLIQNSKLTKNCKRVYFLVKSIYEGKSKIGIAFKGSVISEKESSKKLKLYKNTTAQRVLKHGINYEYFLDIKLDIDLKKITKKKNLPKVEENKFLTKNPEFYNLKKKLKIKKNNDRIKINTERVRSRKRKIYDKKMNNIELQSTRNTKLKIKKFYELENILKKMKKKMILISWAKFLKTIDCLSEFYSILKIYKEKVARKRKLQRISIIMTKFILPMRREKKTKNEGIFANSKK